MSELLKLAERCEKATGPDRELDGLIYRSIDPAIERCWKFWSPAQLETIVPRYTGSLDAAMTLVPEGYAIENFTIWPGHQSSIKLLGTAKRKFGREQTIQWVHDLADGRWLSEAATPALTLCAVALHARASAE